MKSIKVALLIATTLFTFSFNSYSQTTETDTTKTFTFSGSVDAYFHSSLGTTNPFSSTEYNPSTSFANMRGFGIGMVNFIASYETSKAGFVADVVFGPRGKDAVFANMYSEQGIVNQLYAFYKINDKVKINIGQFNTFVGYEVISPTLNFHYSTSYLFSWGPFSHTGARLDFDLGNGYVAKLAVMNPTDLVEYNAFNSYTFGGQVGYVNDNGGVWLNLLYGDQDGKLEDFNLDRDGDGDLDDVSDGGTFQADLSGGFSLTDNFYLGWNASYRTVKQNEAIVGGDIVDAEDADARGFMGVALYPKLTLSDAFSLGLRAEYFSVKSGYIAPFSLDDDGDGNVIDLTLSANYKVGDLTIIPEIRIDKTSEDSFLDKDNEAKDMMTSINLAAVYKF
ncbi:outer membrane beta-barrel protein [Dawidia soli]|uniref:Outer membrane beta-barrel protein n=1 Tax=Dawidia soli TaxID=2782352 RepID=A0AAP2D7I4_9BACT|nr:outer membrane beta-barrel protein [Dawidia soli]MBT1686898.1 outer membrane beta-barrel protein [Dawidia soli]